MDQRTFVDTTVFHGDNALFKRDDEHADDASFNKRSGHEADRRSTSLALNLRRSRSLQRGIESTQRLHDSLVMRFSGLVLLFVFRVVCFGMLVRGVGIIACFLMLGDLLFVSGDLRLMGADARLVAREFLLRPFQDGGGFQMVGRPGGVVAFPDCMIQFVLGVFGGRVHGERQFGLWL